MPARTRSTISDLSSSATTEMMARKAPRPAYSILGHSREDAILLQPWQHALRRYLDDRELIAR